MKLLKLFGLTLICCMLPAIASVRAATLEEPLIIEEQESSNDVLNSRFNELRRGINLTEWFSNTSYFDPNKITDKDLELIKSLGFEHVRLPINSTFLFDENNPQVLNPNYLSYLDSALDKIQSHDLSVIIDLHPKGEFKRRLANDDTFLESVAQFWGSLAAHLSSRNPEQVFLETLNEPAFGYYLKDNPSIDPIKRWDRVQEKLIAAIRQGAPNHTVIAKGYTWDKIDDLLALTPVKDPNVVYNFHFYDPMLFTHQGATWADEEFTFLKNLPYPYNEEACGAAVAEIVNETAKLWAQDYCNKKWDAAKLEKRIAKAATWAKEQNAVLMVNEFGVLRSFVRPEDRTTWIEDVRSLLEKYDMGWTMWEYRGSFGLVRKDEFGEYIADENVVKALGLQKDQPPIVGETPAEIPAIDPPIVGETPAEIPAIDPPILSETPAEIPAIDPPILSETPAEIPAIDPPILSETPAEIPAIDPPILSETPAEIPAIDPPLSLPEPPTAKATASNNQPEIAKVLAKPDPLPRKVPEPSAIAGFVVLTLTAIRLKRNR